MLIVCPACFSGYRISSAPKATDVRCAQCGMVFQPDRAASAPTMLEAGPDWLPVPHQPPVLVLQSPVRASPLPAREASIGRGRIGAPLLAATVLAGLAYACLGRVDLVRTWPGSAAAYAALGLPVTGLRLGQVSTALGDEGPVKVLTVETSITNTRSTDIRLPNMRIVVRDDAEQSLYTWTAPAPRASLGPGEAVAFTSRLVSPPPNGHDLVVSLADGAEGLASTDGEATR